MRKSVFLVALGERDDRPRHRRREEQGAAGSGRGVEDLLELLAEAHVEHLVGFIEHRDTQRRKIERPAFEMIAQPSGRADDDVRAAGKGAALLHRVHAADAGDDTCAGVGVEPLKLLADLDGELARRGDDERERCSREPAGLAFEKRGRHRQAEGDGLARPGLARKRSGRGHAPLRRSPPTGLE